jgi:hypothetical protein
MELWGWVVVVIVIAGIFLAIAGEALVALILTLFWVGAIWSLVTYGGVLIVNAWPAMLAAVALIVLSVATLAVVASALEDRRLGKDRGRPAPPW